MAHKRTRKKLKVAVLVGGVSNERKISLITGREVANNLRLSNFSVQCYDTKKEFKKLFQDAYNKKFNVAFPALHGKFGEDGTIQGMLELLGIPYVGSGVLASALGMDKAMSKKIFAREKNLIPKYRVIETEEYRQNRTKLLKQIKNNFGFPVVVKPNASGSSIGVVIAKNNHQLEQGIGEGFKLDNKIIIEKYIPGLEITVAVLGNKKPIALPVVEIVPKLEFFNLKAKYDPKLCDEIVPARIPARIARQAQRIGVRVYKVLGCRGFSRVDMILKGNKIYVLEINTIPGMTQNSLVPKAARAAGISFPALLKKLVELAYYED